MLKEFIMKLGDLLSFRNDLYFEGAVQADWFYLPEKASVVSENFVFHGKKYFGIEDTFSRKQIDTISLVEELTNKLHDENSNPLTLAIADYGTGKSHFAVTLGQILSGPTYMPNVYKQILSNIENIDIEAANHIRNNSDERNFVMVINGMKDFNLHAEVLKAAQKSLKLYGIADDSLRKLNRSYETATNFFTRNAELFQESFEREADKYGWRQKGTDLLNTIKTELMTNDVAFDIVNAVYQQVNGQEIQWDEGLSAGVILDSLIADLCGLNGQFDHIIILFDEFGRYLEYASSVNSGKSGDSALQQMFESTQNANGALQIVNFIQSDIKTYLQRVDQTKNISRYIGRFDASDKYYISSNLETVFANLIQRKNQDAFTTNIIAWQKRHENAWDDLHIKMNKWLSLKGLWKDFNLFRKVIVEGIYPLHPLSTFMLTQLSDYLQNRSSLTLVSQYINSNANVEINTTPFMVFPEELMKGDLFTEMLAAEQDGKQTSQHCIRYENILRKFSDKLPEESLIVLRSNLILRVLRFKTTSYDEAKEAIKLCSNLTLSQIDEQLHLLEDEYAILGFDDRAGCFDFMEESNGAHDFKILKKRLIASKHFNPALLSSIKIQSIAGVFDNQTTNFGTKYKITTNEWCFKQELMPIEEFDIAKIKLYIEDWNNAVTSISPKGRLIWLYINKQTNQDQIDKIRSFSQSLIGKPIVIMLLNDAENKLLNSILEYDVLDSLDDINRQKFLRHFEDDFRQAETNLRDTFDALKKERLCFDKTGSIVKISTRLSIYLTSVFEEIYPAVVPFWFDSFVTKNNNLGGKGGTYYCTIIKMLLSGTITSDIIHNYPSDVRNRIEALLMENSNTSWKCISKDFKIMPPQEPRSKRIYELLCSKLNDKKAISCKELFIELEKPPYGLSEDIIMLMLSVLCSNLNYCLRVKIKNDINTINLWKESVVIKDKKIDLNLVKQSTFIEVDVDASLSKFIKLFDKIQGNKNINNIDSLSLELETSLHEDNLPSELEDANLLAQRTLDSGKKAKRDFEECFEQIDDYLSLAISKFDFYYYLKAMENLRKLPLTHIFTENGFDFDSESKTRVINYKNRITKYIDDEINHYVSSMFCNSVPAINTFRNHNTKIENMLKDFGFDEYAEKVKAQKERELSNVNEIQSRQDLKDDLKKFLLMSRVDEYSSFMTVSGYLKEATELSKRLKKYELALGSEREDIIRDFKSRITELSNFKKIINDEMSSIWDDLYDISSLDDIKSLIGKIDLIIKKGLSQEDFDDFANMKETLITVLNDLELVRNSSNSRFDFAKASQKIQSKYQNEEMDFDVNTIINDVTNEIKEELDAKEKLWCDKYLSIQGKTRPEIHEWENQTAILPDFLSEQTIIKYHNIKSDADKKIKEGKIEDVLYYFDKLQSDEKEECLKLLLEKNKHS